MSEEGRQAGCAGPTGGIGENFQVGKRLCEPSREMLENPNTEEEKNTSVSCGSVSGKNTVAKTIENIVTDMKKTKQNNKQKPQFSFL